MALAHDSTKTRHPRSPTATGSVAPGAVEPGVVEPLPVAQVMPRSAAEDIAPVAEVWSHPPRAPEARSHAMRGMVAEISASLEPDEVFDDVVESSRAMFATDAAGLWLVTPDRHPLRLVAQHGLTDELIEAIAAITRDDPAIGLRAVAERQSIVLDRPETAPIVGELYARTGFRTICYVPLVQHGEALGLLVLYHRSPYRWTPDELELMTTFANQIAIAVANARLFNSVREGAARLRAIQELSSRLNRIQEIEGIGEAIVAEADRLIGHDTIRVYRVDHVSQMCEPIAFQGEFKDIGTPSFDRLRMRIGEGLTGWVALHNATIRLGDVAADGRGRPGGREPRGRSPCSSCRCRTRSGSWGSSSCPRWATTSTPRTTSGSWRSSRATRRRRWSTPRPSARSAGSSRSSVIASRASAASSR